MNFWKYCIGCFTVQNETFELNTNHDLNLSERQTFLKRSVTMPSIETHISNCSSDSECLYDVLPYVRRQRRFLINNGKGSEALKQRKNTSMLRRTNTV